jgi:hypothetical protein
MTVAAMIREPPKNTPRGLCTLLCWRRRTLARGKGRVYCAGLQVTSSREARRLRFYSAIVYLLRPALRLADSDGVNRVFGSQFRQQIEPLHHLAEEAQLALELGWWLHQRQENLTAATRYGCG